MSRLLGLIGAFALLTTPALAQPPGQAGAAQARPAWDLSVREECARDRMGRCASLLPPARESDRPERPPPADRVYFTATSNRTGAIWAPGRAGADTSLQENRVPLGDQSVGVARRVGAGELSVGYVNREVGHKVGAQSFSRRDDFAGVSFTLRR